LSKLLALRDNEDLKDIWQVSLGDPGRGFVYSRGKMKQTISDEHLSSFSGMFYDSQKYPDGISFSESTIAIETSKLNDAIKLSSGSVALGSLYLNYLIDDAGAKYQKPILKLLDELVAQDANPLFKAFVMRQLQDFVSVRPYAWGIQWSPSLRKDFATLTKLNEEDHVSSSDWMIPRRNRELGPKFAAFFHSISDRSYLREASIMRDLVTTVSHTGLAFAGYIGDDGRPKIIPEAAGNELWTVSSDGKGPLYLKPKKSDAGGFEPVENATPFVPLFYVQADRAQLLADVCKKFNVTPGMVALQASLPPFFKNTAK